MSLSMKCQIKGNDFFKANLNLLYQEAQSNNPIDADGEFNIMRCRYIDNLICERASEAFENVVDMTNGLQPKELAQYFLMGLSRQHRFLQIEFWNTIIQLMKLYASQEDRYFDQRNELSRRMCEEISKNW